MMIKIAVAAFSLGFLTTTAQAATGEMNQLTSLAVPTFECNLPKFKPSGIATNEIRQLQKIESRYKRCVTRFKNKLGEYKKNLVALKKTVSTPEHRQLLDERIHWVDWALSQPMELKGPASLRQPDERDYYDPHHGG